MTQIKLLTMESVFLKVEKGEEVKIEFAEYYKAIAFVPKFRVYASKARKKLKAEFPEITFPSIKSNVEQIREKFVVTLVHKEAHKLYAVME
jgi:homoserine kinase